MVDEKRKRLLLHAMSQVNQKASAQTQLTSDILSRDQLLPFIRKVEAIVSEHDINSAVLAYWSSSDVKWILPSRSELLDLSKTEITISSFSEERDEELDEFLFACASTDLNVVLYGALASSSNQSSEYECCGSLDANVVRRVIQNMAPYFEFIDPMDANKLESAILKCPSQQTTAHLMNSLQHKWKELKLSLPETAQAFQQQKESIGQTDAVKITTEEEQWVRISNNYPYPIANPFRMLDSITNASEKYKEQLKLIENLLALLAGICLSISAQNEPKILADLRDYVSHGVSMGHWREIIRKSVAAWKGSSTKEIKLAKHISQLKIEQTERGFGKAVEQLIRARNDFAHHRGPTA